MPVVAIDLEDNVPGKEEIDVHSIVNNHIRVVGDFVLIENTSSEEL